MELMSERQKKDYENLQPHLKIIARNAKRTGKSIEEYLTDLGFDIVVAEALKNDIIQHLPLADLDNSDRSSEEEIESKSKPFIQSLLESLDPGRENVRKGDPNRVDRMFAERERQLKSKARHRLFKKIMLYPILFVVFNGFFLIFVWLIGFLEALSQSDSWILFIRVMLGGILYLFWIFKFISFLELLETRFGITLDLEK